jgi:Protein of unknown function (DUF2958)
MPLMDEELRARLPPLYAQEAEDDPVVYARFFLPGTYTGWYVIGGEPDGPDFLFFGFVSQPENKFAEFRLSQLEALCGPKGQCVQRDLTFAEGRLTDVVPAPDL